MTVKELIEALQAIDLPQAHVRVHHGGEQQTTSWALGDVVLDMEPDSQDDDFPDYDECDHVAGVSIYDAPREYDWAMVHAPW